MFIYIFLFLYNNIDILFFFFLNILFILYYYIKILIYWVTLSIFQVFECISNTPTKVRLYYIYRALITLWLYLPQTKVE